MDKSKTKVSLLSFFYDKESSNLHKEQRDNNIMFMNDTEKYIYSNGRNRNKINKKTQIPIQQSSQPLTRSLSQVL